MIPPGKIGNNSRDVFFVIRLILSTPVGKFVLRGKGSAPTTSRHDVIQFRSKAFNKIAYGPAFPNVFLKVNHTKSILRFDIRFWSRPIQKRKCRPRADTQRRDKPEVLFRTIQPERVEIERKRASRCRHAAILARGRHLWILLQFLRHPLCSFPPITIRGVRRSAFCRLRWLIR